MTDRQATNGSPTLFYLCYDANTPAGGEKHCYQHVEVLTSNGYRAFVWHGRNHCRLTWFDNNAPIVGPEDFRRLYRPDSDYLVFPETFGSHMLRFPGRRVIFNKGLFSGYRALSSDEADPCLDCATLAILAVSSHNAHHLRMSYPSLPVFQVHASISLDLFTYVRPAHKKRIICCAAKNAAHTSAVYRAFRARAGAKLNRGENWQWELVTNKTEAQVAALLRQAAILLFTSIDEGLPRLPIEAMACGTAVVGYNCGPLNEIAPEYMRATYGDVSGLTRQLEEFVEDYECERSQLERCSTQGLRIASKFTRERQQDSVLQAWSVILKGDVKQSPSVECG
jgi:glycosyltransferase involved in cell wall biosynthesis